jgi:hypothetical protein
MISEAFAPEEINSDRLGIEPLGDIAIGDGVLIAADWT